MEKGGLFGIGWIRGVGGLENWTIFMDVICVSSLKLYQQNPTFWIWAGTKVTSSEIFLHSRIWSENCWEVLKTLSSFSFRHIYLNINTEHIFKIFGGNFKCLQIRTGNKILFPNSIMVMKGFKVKKCLKIWESHAFIYKY